MKAKETSPAILKLTVIEGKLFRDTELIGEMDPYLVLTDNYGVTCKTRVLDDAGKHAVWNEQLALRIKDGINALIKVQIFDEDLIKDTIIGEATFPVEALLGDSAHVI